MTFSRKPLILLLGTLLSSIAYALDWQPILDSDLKATQSVHFPNTPAEMLYLYQEVDNDIEYSGTRYHYYFRIKIYEKSALEKFNKIDIPMIDDLPIRKLSARIIKSDGRITELDKKAFYQQEIFNSKKIKIKATSFSFPGMEVGDIIEYKYEIRAKGHSAWVQINPEKEIPVRTALFRVKRLRTFGVRTQSHYYKCGSNRFHMGKDGFESLTLQNIPALKEEPLMPPPGFVRSMILFYSRSSGSNYYYWGNTGASWAEEIEKETRKPSKLVQETAKEIVGNTSNSIEQAKLINDYCRTRIINILHDTPPSGKAVKPKPSPDYTLKHKQGNSYGILVLFHALARSIGLDTRVVLCSDMRDGPFQKDITVPYFLSDLLIAVKGEDGNWHLFDPTNNIIPTGTLNWYNEGVTALVTGDKESHWTTTRITPTEESKQTRTATLELTEDGTLLGDIRMEYHGHYAARFRDDFMRETPEKIQELISANTKRYMPLAEISKVETPNIGTLLETPYVTLKIRVPNYAEILGKRIFLQPNLFSKGSPPIFTAETREHDIFFRYPQSQDDNVTIKLPAGFSLEAAQAPASISDADWGSYTVKMGYAPETHTLHYSRKFIFLKTYLRKDTYPAIKTLFDAILLRDQHTLTLKVNTPEESTATSDE